MIFSTSDKEITLIYNSKNRIGKQILALAQAEDLPIREINLVNVTLTPTHWAELASRMEIDVKELVNTEDADFLQKFGDLDDLSTNDWLKLLVDNPETLKAPIVMKGEKIVAMTNPRDMLYFVEEKR